jgi:hypothetical protein
MFYPVQNYEPFEASLQIKINGEWVKMDGSRIFLSRQYCQFQDRQEIPVVPNLGCKFRRISARLRGGVFPQFFLGCLGGFKGFLYILDRSILNPANNYFRGRIENV